MINFEQNGFFRILAIEKVEVLGLDFSSVEKFIKDIKDSEWDEEGSLVLSVSGYDDDERELYEIREVRKYFRELLKKHPYIFYFLNEGSWKLVYLCACANIETLTSGDTNKEKQVAFRIDKEFILMIMDKTINYEGWAYDEKLVAFVEKLKTFLLTGEIAR